MTAALPEGARSDGRLIAWGTLVAVLTAVNYAGNLTSGADDRRDAVYTWSFAVSGFVQFALMLSLVLVIANTGAARDLLALRRPRSLAVAAGLALAVLVGTYVVAFVLSPLLQPGDEQGLVPEDWNPDRAPQFFVNAMLIVAFVPVVEELTFRGLGFGLLERFGTSRAIAVTAVAFALAHGLVEALPIFVAFACGLAYLRHRTRSIYPCVVLHGTFNAIALAVSLAG